MICNNCGKEFEGKFCPDCGTSIEEPTTDVLLESQEEVEEQPILVCPNCGQERIGDGKFCVNCGFNYEGQKDPVQTDNYVQYKKERKINLSSATGIIAKVYRYILAGGMLFLGLIALLCLTSPTITEEFLGMKNNLCSGFVAIGNGAQCDAPMTVVNASRMLLIVSLIALVYGGYQLNIAIKKPYRTVKKIGYWIADGIISLVLIILGGVVSTCASNEGMNGSAGSGFSMCIAMGVFGLIFLAARIFYELKVFNWEDTGLSEEQIAKSLEKKPKKQRKPKEIAVNEDDQTYQPQSVIMPEIKAAKKRRRSVLIQDLIIALIPIVFGIFTLILFFGYLVSYDVRELILIIVGSILGAVWFITLIVRCVSEVRLYKWVDPYPNKKMSVKKRLFVTAIVFAMLAAIIVPTVLVSTNIFRAERVDMLNLGDSKYRIENILGEPDVKSYGQYEYFSGNYLKLAEQIEDAMDDLDMDELEKLMEKLENLTYKYIRVTFNSSESIESIFLDTNRCDGNVKAKKKVKDYKVISSNYGYDYDYDYGSGYRIRYYKIEYSVKYKDGSFYKAKVKAYEINGEVEWQDEFGNTFDLDGGSQW